MERIRKARANQLDLVVAMAVASTSSVIALLPLKLSCRTIRACSCARRRTGVTRSTASATAATPLTEAPWPDDEGGEGAGARLTTCSKQRSLTTLRLHVNVAWLPKPLPGDGPGPQGPGLRAGEQPHGRASSLPTLRP